MSSTAVVYLERTGRGAALVRATVFDDRGRRTWTPSAAMADSARKPVEAAATWVAQSVGTDAELTVCLDLDGGACGWLTTPSADEPVVKAVARSIQAGQTGYEAGQASTVTAAWLSQVDIGVDVSLQALPDSLGDEGNGTNGTGGAPHGAGKKGGQGLLKRPPKGAMAAGAAGGAKHRLAVMSLPDLPARVFVDALDESGVTAARVMSFWHAMAEAWDPSAGANEGDAGHAERVVASDEPCTAIVIIDPAGRLIWCWSREGRLLTGSFLRLRQSVAEAEPAKADGGEGAAAGAEEAGGVEAARRLPGAVEPAKAVSVVEVSRSEVGRVISDWLTWGTQLGVAPSRIVCLGPTAVTSAGLESDLPDVPGVAAVAQALGRAWPGAAVQAAVDEDPIGATFERLVGSKRSRGGAKGAVLEVQGEDPRRSLIELSQRPGRANRVFYRWAAAAMGAGAVLIAATGFWLSRAAQAADAGRADAETAKLDALAGIKSIMPAPGIDPVKTLENKLKELRDAGVTAKPQKPVLAELARVIRAVAAVPGRQLKSIFLVQPNGMMTITADNGEVAQKILDQLKATPSAGPEMVAWDMKTNISPQGLITCSFTGPWVPTPKSGGQPAAPAAAAKPAATKAPEPTTQPPTAPKAPAPPSAPTKPGGKT